MNDIPLDESTSYSKEDFDRILHELQFVPDPQFEKLRRFGPNIMRVYLMDDPRPYPKHNFFWRCWDAWRPTRRRQRERKLMRQETPVANLLWRVWNWIRYSKAHRAKPWKVEMHFDTDHAMMKGDDWPLTTSVIHCG